MADPVFEFIVEESFRITGRGVGVLGKWRSGQFTSVTADTFSWALR
jgi:hypothetical protein